MAGERSRLYPRYSLKAAIESVEKVRAGLGRGAHDAASIAQAMEMAPASGPASSRISSMVQFGLLLKSRAGYEVSDLALSILTPRDDVERDRAIVEACKSPKMYADILDRFAQDGRLPAQLANILVRDFGIVPNMADKAVDRLTRSFKYAGILDPTGVLHLETESHSDPEEDVESAGDPQDQMRQESRGTQPLNPSPAASPMQGGHEFRIGLGAAREIVLVLPSDVTPRDIRILEAQLSVIRLLADDEDAEA